MIATLAQIFFILVFLLLLFGALIAASDAGVRRAFRIALHRRVTRLRAPRYAIVGDSLAAQCDWRPLRRRPFDVLRLCLGGATLKDIGAQIVEARMGGGGNGGAEPIRDVAGVKLFAKAVSGIDAKDLKSLVDEAKKTIGSGVVAIANASVDGKAGVVVGVTADLTARYNAVDLVRVASEKLGGKGGGGRPDLAQAGGPDATALEAALTAIEETLRVKAAQ